MTQIIGGHNLGLQFSSYTILNRKDTTSKGTLGHAEETFVNVSNGNLIYQDHDAYLPSLGQDFDFVRTYNSRDATTGQPKGWHFFYDVTLSGGKSGFTVTYGDGSDFNFTTFDSARNVWISSDGAGAFETLQQLSKADKNGAVTIVTRADQVQYGFDKGGTLVSIVDANGVKMTFSYQGNRMTQLTDDTGHVITFNYQGSTLTSVSDESGATLVSYGYSSGLLTSVTDRDGHKTVYGYENHGLLSSITLPNTQVVNGQTQTFANRTTTFTYQQVQGSSYVVTSIVDANGGVTRFDYSQAGSTRVIDALGQSVVYAYDANGMLTRVTDELGFQTNYTYDAKGNLTAIVDANGYGAVTSDSAYFRALRKDLGYIDLAGNGRQANALSVNEKNAILAKFTSTFIYDGNGNLLSATDNAGNVTTYTYTAFNKIATIKTANGGVTTYAYDANENLTRRVDALGNIVGFAYDVNGNLTTRTVYLDKSDLNTATKQQITQYAYDAFGNNTQITDGEGNVTSSTFDHFGNMLTSKDGRGDITTYLYDNDNRLLRVTTPEGNSTSYAYDAVGNRISVTDANGHAITQVFDANNMLLATIDSASGNNPGQDRKTSYQYDVLGNGTRVTDAEGRVTTYTYDAHRRLVDQQVSAVLNGAEQQVSYHQSIAYDGESNIVTTTDRNGNVTQYLFTTNELLKRVTDAIGNVTEYLYDSDLNQVQVTVGAQLAAAQQRVTKFGFDLEDRKTSETDALGHATTYAYDAPGNVVALTDGNNHTSNFEYDRDNRLLKEIRPTVTDTAHPGGVRYTVLHAYDANGNEIQTTDENGHVETVAFDGDDRLVMITDANGIKTVFSYDSRGNRTQSAIGVTATYDATTKHVTQGDTSHGQVQTFQYDEFNQLVGQTDGVGNALATSDDATYQKLRADLGFAQAVAGLSADDKTALRARFTDRYLYDRVGNMLAKIDHLKRVTTLQYDALDRIQSETEATGNALQRTTTYRYDGDDNVVKTTDALGRVSTATYDAVDRLVDSTNALGVTTHNTYDNVGNLLTATRADGTTDARTVRFVYDLDNLLVGTTDPAGNAESYVYDAVGNRVQVTDARGGVTQYLYDALDRNIRIIDPLNFQTRYEYDGVGNRISITDARGGITRLTYDAGDRLLQATDAEGRVTTYTYDALSYVLTATTASGKAEAQTTTYQYDAEGNLRQVTDAAGKVTSRSFDAVYNLTSIKDANGHVTSYAFDALNRQIQLTDAMGGVTKVTYDLADNIVSMEDALHRVRKFAYDAGDRMITETDALGVQTQYQYDSVDNQVKITRAANTAQAATDTFVYDKDDRLVSHSDALGHATTYAYDAASNVTGTTDALGRVTHYAYDADNRVKTITDAIGNATQYVYDGNGNRVQVIDARGNAQTTYYNLDNEVVLTVDGEGEAVAKTYDGNGNVATITQFMTRLAGVVDSAVKPVPSASPSDRVTTFGYDSLDRVVKLTDALGGITTYSYDAVGNQLSRTDQNGHTTQFAYDALDRMTQQTDAMGGVRKFGYDAVSNLQSETDENGHATIYAYDAKNRLVQQTDALGFATNYTYDAVDNRLSQTDRNGHTTSYAYDLANRMVSQTNALGKVTTYGYDVVGNRTSLTDENGHTTTFDYDADNRVTRQTDALGDSRLRSYDAAGNMATFTDENGKVTAYAYDRTDRLISETDPLSKARTYTYDAVGNRISVTDENNHKTTYEFDADNRPTKTTDPMLGVHSYTYDAAGNQRTETDENGHTTTYTYDADDRVLTRTDPRAGQRTFTYDAVGNRQTDTDENGNLTRYTYDADDRMVKRTDATGHFRTYEYDATGNYTKTTDENGHATTFVYDAVDRLVKTTDPLLGVRTFTYDNAGNQLTDTDENGHTTTFVYDNANRLVSRTDALAHSRTFEYDAAGNTTKTVDENGHATTFTYDGNNRVKSQTNALGKSQLYDYDGVGNRIQVTDENGHATQYSYDKDDRLASVTDALGRTTTYGYDGAGNQTSETDPNGNTTTYNFDEDDRIVKETDALGYQLTFKYDAVGNVLETSQQLSLTDPTKVEVVRNAFDALNRKVATLSAEGYLTTYGYDAVGQQTTLTQYDSRATPTAQDGAPLTVAGTSRVTTATYDADGRKLTETSALGITTRYEYDAAGNRTARIDADGTTVSRRTEIHYDAANRVAETVDAMGIVTHIDRDNVGNMLALHEAFGTANERITSYQYDVVNRVSVETDALGFKTQLTYDDAGNLVKRVSAVGVANEERTEQFEYDAADQMTAQVNGENERTEFAYDGAGNRTTITVAKGLAEQRINRFRYDGDNRLVGQIDGNGVETRYQLDGAGNKVRTTQLAATYDSAGNEIDTYQGQPIAGLQRETVFTYDLDNRLTSVTDPKGGLTSYVLDALGNRTKITDANGTVTNNIFDAGGRLVSNLVNAGGHGGVLTTNAYDLFDNVTQTRRGFADGTDTRQTTYTYDKLDRQLSFTDYDKVDNYTASTVFVQAFSTTFHYDAFGNQTQISQGVYLLNAGDAGYDATKAARVHALTGNFKYDALDQLKQSIDGEGNVIGYSYDAHGNRTAQTTGFGTTDARTVSFTYDKADRIVRQQTGVGGLIEIGYDKAGNEVTRDTLQSGTEASGVWIHESFGYDGNGEVIRETDGLNVVTTHKVDAFGNIVETRLAQGTTDERVLKFEFDKDNNLVAQTDAMGNRTAFGVDSVGNRISETDALGHVTRLYYNGLNQQIGSLDADGYFVGFTRDSAGNILTINVYLQQYTAPADGVTPPAVSASDTPRTTTSEYDGAGNLVKKIDADQRVKEFTLDSAGKVTQITDYGSSDATELSRTFDKGARIQTFAYDLAGRLTTFVNVDGVIETYTYDTANNRISETITNPNPLANGNTDPVRTTLYKYDAVNQLISQTFDPTGLNLVQKLTYDLAGNTVSKIDQRNFTTTLSYDLDNQLLSIKDPLANVTTYTYDRVGNRTTVKDGRGAVTTFTYDLDNRVLQVISPAVDVFTIAGGLQTGMHPTNTSVYDAVGNLVQTIDANGNKTTQWYDAVGNEVAELNGDDVLREFTVDAVGSRTSTTLYMTRLLATAHDPATRPAAPSGEKRTITSQYDAMGRLVETTYPTVDITTLSGVDTDTPTAATASATPTQQHFYDAFGNLVESINTAGAHTYAYFDRRDRVVATVDAAGFLVETSWDDQGNVVEQRKYEHALTSVSAGTKPAPTETPIAVVDRVYDTANRMTQELSPTVQLDGSQERILTRFAYDAAGNLISRTRAAGTTDASTEYSYYDADNRLVALVNAARTLHVFGYDANGNQTSLTRYYTSVPGSIDLTSATLNDVLGSVPLAVTKDQKTTVAFDAMDREIKHTDLMGVGDADDIVKTTQYDALGNATERVDGDGFAAMVAYDALSHAVQSVSPDGNSTFVEYDAAGLRVRAWTGDLGSVLAQPATNVTAAISSNLDIRWHVPAGAVQSYVVYDTAAHDTPSAYAQQTSRQGAGDTGISISLAALAPGSVVYFRVVTVDAAGSIAWTGEQKLTVPARLSDLSIGTSGNDLVITAHFSGAVTNAKLNFGAAGSSLSSHVNFVLQADGSYQATISAPANGGAGLAYQLQWDFGGNTFTTSAIAVNAPGAHTAVSQTVSIVMPAGANGTSASNGEFVIVNGQRVTNAFQVNGTLQFDPGLSAAGTYTYHVYYGDQVATTHTVNVTFDDHQSTSVLSDTTTSSSRTLVLHWNSDVQTHVSATLSSAEAGTVGTGGVHARIKPADASDVFTNDVAMGSSGGTSFAGTFDALSAGSYDLQVYYVDTSGHTVIVEWTRISVPAHETLPNDVTVVDNSSPFDFAGQSVTSGGVTDNTFPFNLARVVTVGSPVSLTGHSVTVFGTERNGTITRANDGTLSVSPGVYTGAVDVSNVSFAVPSTATSSAGAGSAKQDGLSAGTYYNEYEYNALGKVIATNEGTGLWRRFGVDVNGNAVETSVYGTKADETAGKAPIVTYAAFDARNEEIADFAAAVPVDGLTGLHRAVTRATFDYAGQILTRLDPGTAAAQKLVYDAAGNLISQTDPLGFVTTIAYDRRGNEVKRTDPLGHVRRREYDLDDRLVKEYDALDHATTYTVDAFDRTTQVTDALGHSQSMAYDQHDRLVEVTDALGLNTFYSYDNRDNRTWTEDANQHFFGQAYDSMGRVTHLYSFQESSPITIPFTSNGPTTLADAQGAVTNAASAFRSLLVDEVNGYDAYGNKISTTDAEGRTHYYTYGAFSRLISETDEAQRVTTYTFDRFGRMTLETRPVDATVTGAKDIIRSYDDAGRLLEVNDVTTQTDTKYTYDIAGRRKTEITLGLDLTNTLVTLRSITYTYDGAGQLKSWADSVTAKTLSYEYDGAGNVKRVSGSDSTDHRYTYDDNDRVTKITQGASTVLAAYTYDDAGRQATFDDGTNTATYTFDSDGRVMKSDITLDTTPNDTSDDTHAKWMYDNVGNVTKYQEFAADNTTVMYLQSTVYSANYRVLQVTTDDDRDASNKSDVSTTNTLDKSGRILVETQVNSSDSSDVKTTTYTHNYSADGRELTITATGTGDVSGSTASTYDADDHLVKVDLGQGDGLDSDEIKQFLYNSDGQIITRLHDDGKNDNTNPITQYLYANGNPVGLTGTKTDGTIETLLDIKQFNPVQDLSDTFPTSSVSEYVVQPGDDLQIIAGRVYGNPSLWYVLADANGLKGSELLKPGTHLTVPNTVDNGRLTADTHVVYHESDIVGSTLPNLKSPPPNKCLIALAIILAIIIAIIAIAITIATAGIGAEIGVALLAGELPTTAALIAGATGGLAGAGLVIGAEGALTGAAVAAAVVGGAIGGIIGGTVAGFVSSAITQGIQIGFGLQKSFDWKQVASDVITGAIGGIGGAFSTGAQALAQVARLAVTAVRIARVAAVIADAALNVASEAAGQATVHDGRIEQPWMLGVAAAGAVLGEIPGLIGSRAIRLVKKVKNSIQDAIADGAADAVKSGGKGIRAVDVNQVVSTKSLSDIAGKSDSSLAASVRKVDADSLVNDEGKAVLKLKNAKEAEGATGDTAVYVPKNAKDAQVATLSNAKSQSDLDQVADAKVVEDIRDLKSGQTTKFDDNTVTDFAETSVGKVKDPTDPLPKVATVTPQDAKLNAIDTSIADGGKIVKTTGATDASSTASGTTVAKSGTGDVSTGGADVSSGGGGGKKGTANAADVSTSTTNSPKAAVVDVKAKWNPKQKKEDLDKHIQMLEDLVAADGAKPLPRDRSLPNFNKITPDVLKPEDYKLPKLIRESGLPQRAQDLVAEPFAERIAQWRYNKNAERNFLKAYDQPGNPFLKDTDQVSDFGNNFTRSDVAKKFLNDRAQAYRTGFTETDKIGKAFKVAPDPEVAERIEKTKWYETAALKGYTDQPTTANQAVTDLGTNLGLKSGADYNYINPILRGQAKDAELKELYDPYVRLAVRGLNRFDAHKGIVYRGGEYSDDLIKNLMGSGTYTERAFLSTSTDPKVAGSFVGETIFVINSRGGARKVQSISGVASEQEATFAPGTQFKVLKIVDHGQKVETGFGMRQRIVYLDEIPIAKPSLFGH